ncbi:MAG: REP-associated tyrosine transposase [Opitutaceae bacterium]
MTINILPRRKTENLRIGRVSIPRARYFITLCTDSRKSDLTPAIVSQIIRDTWRQQHQDQDIILHCATIMPDHIHWLCTLGERLTLAQTISKFKTLTNDALAENELKWQRNYYDHRLRADTALESFAKYIFLNPYRRKLITTDAEWPYWALNKNYQPEFIAALKDRGFPPPEWLETTAPLKELIETDLEYQTNQT